jgi:hypothetical protein
VRWFNDDDAVKVLVLTGAGRSAQGAFQIGFVNRLAKPDALANTDQALAEPTAANDPLSMTAGKWTAMITAGYPLSESFERAESIWGPVYLSVSMHMASGATWAKRSPKLQLRCACASGVNYGSGYWPLCNLPAASDDPSREKACRTASHAVSQRLGSGFHVEGDGL